MPAPSWPLRAETGLVFGGAFVLFALTRTANFGLAHDSLSYLLDIEAGKARLREALAEGRRLWAEPELFAPFPAGEVRPPARQVSDRLRTAFGPRWPRLRLAPYVTYFVVEPDPHP